jgi:ketosteroid isomerase-like protein
MERVLERAAPEIEFVAVRSDSAGRTEPYPGHEGIRQYFRDVAEVWDELRLTPTDYRVVGEQVLVTGRVSARSPARVVSGSTGWLWRVSAGKVVRGRVFASAEDAVATVRAEPGSTELATVSAPEPEPAAPGEGIPARKPRQDGRFQA